ncbi:MAG: NAD-dependent epimerase/dehydratase family protein [Parasporobacterium sp.]|nr:NAD-dependent epimerase/dehydratase family protein [Parasporobacterium sp.]
MAEYIVTGAGGVLGFAIVKELLGRGITPRCLIRSEKTKPLLEELGAKVYTGDITKKKSLNEIFDVDGEIKVIHAASFMSVRRKITDKLYRVNTLGTKNIVEICREKNAGLVYISAIESAVGQDGVMVHPYYDSDRVRGGYAKTKARASRLVIKAASEGLDACILLPCTVMGPDDYRKGFVTSAFIRCLRHRYAPFIRGACEITDSRDVAKAAVEALSVGRKGESYILSNEYCDISDFVNMMRKEAGLKKIKWYIPVWAMRAAAAVYEPFMRLKKKEPVFTRYTIARLNEKPVHSSELAVKDLGYAPRPAAETAHAMVEFYKRMKWI